MLAQYIFYVINIQGQNWVGGGSNSKHSILYFDSECIDSKLDKI